MELILHHVSFYVQPEQVIPVQSPFLFMQCNANKVDKIFLYMSVILLPVIDNAGGMVREA